MKISKLARVISAILAIAVVLCSMPISLGMTALAENATADYSALESASKLDIEYYYSTLGMHDGAGLEVVNGEGVTVDDDWAWQINMVENAFEAKDNAYAIYFIEQGTDFTAYFSSTTDLDDMKVYVSGNGVDWDVAQTTKDYAAKTISLIDQPEYISYVKIIWPLYLYKSTLDTPYFQMNALKSVDFTQGTHSANYKRINFANASGIEAFEQNHLSLSKGVISPTYSILEGATAENSFNGFVSYMVQPGTRFSLTVTNMRGSEAIGTKLGYENPLDYSVEIYASSDNVNFTKLENVYTNSARHPNNVGGKDAIRSTDYSFIVPDDAVIVKCKFPMTQNLKSAGLWGYIGNDIMGINKVEYTALPEYDYTAIDSSVALTKDTKDQYGIADSTYYNRIKRWNGAVGYDWNGAYYSQIPEITYNVSPKTHFSIQFSKVNGFGAYVAIKDYVLKLQGWSPEQNAWVDAATLTLTANDANIKNAMMVIPAEENLYTKVKVVWPRKASDSACGEGAMNIATVSFTQSALHYNYAEMTDVALNDANKSRFAISEFEGTMQFDSGKIDPNGSYLTSSGKTVSVVYDVELNSYFRADFTMKWYPNLNGYLTLKDYVLKLQGHSEETNTWVDLKDITIPKGTTISANGGKYTIELTEAENKYTVLRILWPSKANDSYNGDDTLALTSVDVKPVEGSSYDYADLTTVALSAENKAQLGLASYSAGLVKSGVYLNPSYGKNGVYAQYNTVPGTNFIAKFITLPNLKHPLDKADYVMTIKGWDVKTSTWVIAKQLVIPKGTDIATLPKIMTMRLTPEENDYTKIRIQWQNAVDNVGGGEWSFGLTRVTFTQSENYDYTDYDGDGVCVTKPAATLQITTDNVANYGATAVGGDLRVATDGQIDPDGNILAGNGHATTWLGYTVAKNTPFYAAVNVKWSGHLNNYLKLQDYVLTLQGKDTSGNYVAVKTITIPMGSTISSNTKYGFKLTAAENIYTELRIIWPAKVNDVDAWIYYGDDSLALTEVSYSNSEIKARKTLEALSYEEIPVETITATKVVLRPTINNVYIGDKIELDGLQVGLTYATGETRIVDYGFETEKKAVVGENIVVVKCRGAEVAVPVVGYCYMGDFNRDKNVDILDLVRLKKCSAGVAENEGANITVNGDSSIAGIMVEFKKYLLDASEINFAKQWKGHANDTVNFTFNGTVTSEVVNNYLGRAVNYNLGYTTDYYGGTFDSAEFYEGLGVVLNVGGKYIQRAGGEWNMSGKLMSRHYDTIKECIEYAHSIDPELIFEAGIFESVAGSVGQITVPAWVHEKFGVQLEDGVTEKSYTRADVIFADEVYEANELLENGNFQSTPDITNVNWQMLVYYRATQYIDLGYEAIHLGQTGLTGINDTDNAAWAKVIGLIREYAAENARRGYVLINSHDDFEDFVYDGKHLVDFIMSPVRPDASDDETEVQLPSETDAQECVIKQGHWGAPYGAGYSGVAPTGETYENYPYIVEFDNYGDSIPGGEENIGNPDSYIWGLDEYSWYCNQPEWYKVEFLDYMLNELQTVYKDNGHISMPLGRGGYYDVISGVGREYSAVGSDVEDFVKNCFAG